MTDVINDNQIFEYSSADETDKKQSKSKRKTKKTKKKENGDVKNIKGNTHASTFKDFQLREELMRSLGEAGFENPSEVQSEGIPYIIYGDDLLCQAKSGMGKTAVFVLGVLHSLEIPGNSFQAVVLCHARELAFQISKEFERLGKYIEGLQIQVILGGVNEDAQILQLQNNPPHVVIGTPGRFYALVKKKKILLDNLKFFILDECDQMLEQYEMRQTVQNIFTRTNLKKQVLMFTATLNARIKQITKKFMSENAREIIINEEKNLTLHGLSQFYIKVSEKMKNKNLFNLLHQLNYNQVIIFTSKVQRAKYLNKLLNKMEFQSIAIHRDLNQHKRYFNKN